MKNKLPLAILIVLIIGCSAKQTPMPQANLKAIDLNRRAETAFSEINYPKALSLYTEALRINRSIENSDGIAVNLINISAVHRKMGESEKAESVIEELLTSDSPRGFGNKHMSEAAFIKALLRLDADSAGEAEDWAEKSLSYCAIAGCDSAGKIYNLMARVSLKKGDATAAIAHAERALKLNKERGHKEEAANSIRLVAEAKALAGDRSGALALYEDALSADKALGLSGKIALDLMGAGNALFEMGKIKEAEKYFKRALEVSLSGGNEALAAKSLEMIRKCEAKK